MPFMVTCPQCKRKLKIGDDAAGKRIRCPRCATVFPVLLEEASVLATSRTLAMPDDEGAPFRDPHRAKGMRQSQPAPEDHSAERANHDYDDESEQRIPRRRRAVKGKQRKANLALRVSVLILALIGGLFSGGLGVAWLKQVSSPEVKAMREFATAVANETGSRELKDNLARLDRMVRSSYFLLLAAPLGIAGGVLVLRGRTKLGGALMLATVPVPLVLNLVALMSLYFLLVGGLVALLTPSWPSGEGPTGAVMGPLTAGGWVAVLVGWVVLILALPKYTPEVNAGGGPAVVPPGSRGDMGVRSGGPPTGPPPSPTPTSKPQTPSSPAEEAVSISAEDLTKEYLADREAADRKFKDKLLVVDGIVHFNFIARADWFSVELKGVKKGGDQIQVVVCHLRRDLQGKLSPDAVHEGQSARLKGRCTGLDWLNRPRLTDCEPVPGTRPAGAGAPDGGAPLAWKEITSEEAGLSILFPGKPTADTDGSLRRFYLVLEGGEIVYFVGSEQLSKELLKEVKSDKQFLEQFKAPSQPGRKAIRDKDIALGRYPGVEHVEESSEGSVPSEQILRAYLAEGRRYQLGVFYTKRRKDQADPSKFLDSFKPLPAATGEEADQFEVKTVGERIKQLQSGRTTKGRGSAAQALAQFGPKAKEAIPALVEALRKDNPGVGCYAAEALVKIGPDSVKGLTEAAKDKKPSVRLRAVWALGQMRIVPEEAVKTLTEAMKEDKDTKVRMEAASALGRLEADKEKKK